MAVVRSKGLIRVTAAKPSGKFSTLKGWFTLPSTTALQTSYLQYAFQAMQGASRSALVISNKGSLPFAGQAGVSYQLSYVGFQGIAPDPITWTVVPLTIDASGNFSVSILDAFPGATYLLFLTAITPSGKTAYAPVSTTPAPSDEVVTAAAAAEAAKLAEQAVVKAAQILDLCMVYNAGQAQLQWTAISGAPDALYEVRLGATPAGSKILGQVKNAWIASITDGTYWVAACYQGVYSAWQALEVVGSTLAQTNLILNSDEVATGWTGTLTGAAKAVSGMMSLSADQTSGTYEPPAAGEFALAHAHLCTVQVLYAFEVVDTSIMVDDWPDVDLVEDVDGALIAGPTTGDVQIQIATDPGTGVFGPWQPFTPGQYPAARIHFRAVLNSYAPNIIPYITNFGATVTVPDFTQKGTNVACPPAGIQVVFGQPFDEVPNVQTTILNRQPGDVEVFTAGPTGTGFTIQVQNGGVGVARFINWQATGY